MAAIELRQPENWEKFKKKKGALSIPRRNRNQKTEQVPLEYGITTELEPFLRQFRREVPGDHFLAQHQVAFQAEYHVPSENRAGPHSKKADFYVYTQTGGNPTEIVIEAKPLVKERDISHRYLGKDGIGCFFMKDSPYTRGPLGGILAYTINNTERSFRLEIHAALNKYNPPVCQLANAEIQGEPEPLTFSRHKRPELNLDPITILHFELIFPTDILDSPIP